MKRLSGTSLREQGEAGFSRWCVEAFCGLMNDFPYREAAAHVAIILFWIACVLTMPLSVPLIAAYQMLDARKQLAGMRAMSAEIKAASPERNER